MSLINQALKLEQQKRQTTSSPVAPMVAHMAHRRQSDKMPLLLAAFTGMGLLFAACITALFYFGSDYLDSEKSMAVSIPPEQADTPAESPVAAASQSAEPSQKIEALLGNLSDDQLSTVQKMLIEREAAEAMSDGSTALENASESHVSETPTVLSERSRIQAIIDSYSVQGIRKAGQETRVFMNGKIRKIGDVVDIENRLRLIGFSETALVFADASGERFEKTL